MKKYIITAIALTTSIFQSALSQNNCDRAIEMLNKGKMDSCDYFLTKAGYYSGNYVNDKSDCLIPFNTAKEKKYMSDAEKNPKDGNALGSVAIADYWLKKYDDAVKYYTMAIDADPKTEWYYTNLSYLYQSKLNNKDKADEITELFLKNNPTSDNYTNAGGTCFQNGDYSKAIKYFKKALNGGDVDYKAYNNIGICFLKLNSCDSATFYSKKSFLLKKDYSNTADNLVDAYNCHLSSLKSSSDIKAFTTLYASIKDQFPTTFNRTFNIFDRLNYSHTKYYEAVKDLASKPTSDGYFKLAEHLSSEEDYDGAFKALENSIKLNPKNGDANFNLGFIYLDRKKDYKKALQYFNAAFPSLSPLKQENCLYNTGLCYQGLEDNTNAINTFKKVLAKNPTDKNTHYRLYMVYEKIGDTKNALYHKQRS